MATILYVDDEPTIGLRLRHGIETAGHHAVGATSVQEALQAIARGGVDLIVADHQMPVLTGLDLIAILRRDGLDIPVIILTGYADIAQAVAAVRLGAIDYLTKPVDPQALEIAIDRALHLVQLRRDNSRLRDELAVLRQHQEIVGESAGIRRALAEATMAAPTRAAVLLLGERGVGKERFARAIHDMSDRRDGPFVHLHCAAIPDALAEGVLLDACERAHRGTLHLDEVSELRLDLQSALLRLLQDQAVTRDGGDRTVRTDLRIIATSARDLAAAAAAGQFRQELALRLSVAPITIPALRERLDDIPLLAMHFVRRASREHGKTVTGIATGALEWLRQQAWPGNVRELQHRVERAVLLASEPELALGDFMPNGRIPATGAASTPADDGDIVLKTLNVAEAEARLIESALARTGGNRTHAAQLLGISLRTLRARLNAPAAD